MNLMVILSNFGNMQLHRFELCSCFILEPQNLKNASTRSLGKEFNIRWPKTVLQARISRDQRGFV